MIFFKMNSIKSFLIIFLLPQTGHLDKKEKYSKIFFLFHLFPHVKHFIFNINLFGKH